MDRRVEFRSDLQVIDSGATALDVLALVLKQLASLGVPGPHDIAKLSRFLDVFVTCVFYHSNRQKMHCCYCRCSVLDLVCRVVVVAPTPRHKTIPAPGNTSSKRAAFSFSATHPMLALIKLHGGVR